MLAKILMMLVVVMMVMNVTIMRHSRLWSWRRRFSHDENRKMQHT